MLSYWATVSLQQEELPGIRAQLRVETFADTTKDPNQVLEELSSLAESHGGSMYVELPSPDGQRVYGAGEEASRWIAGQYRSLPGVPQREAHPLVDLPHADYRQMVEFSGSAKLVEETQSYFDSRGVKYEVAQDQRWAFLLSGTALGSLFQLLLSFCLAMCVIGAVLNMRSDAIRNLHGYSLTRSCAYEVQRASGSWVVFVLAALIGISLGVACWAGTKTAVQWLYYFGIFAGSALIVCGVSMFGAFFALRRTDLVAALDGRFPARSAVAGVYIVRLAALIAVASLSVASINHSAEWFKQDGEKTHWAEQSQSYGITLSGARDLEGVKQTSEVLAQKVRELSARGHLLYASYIDAGMVANGGLDRDLLIFNRSAARRSLEGPLLESFNLSNECQEACLLKPAGLSAKRAATQISSFAEGAPELQEIAYEAEGSSAKTWEVGDNAWMNRARVDAPYVMVVPDDRLGMSDRNIVAALSQKDALLTRYADFEALQSDPEVGSFIRSAAPMSQIWAAQHRDMARLAWIYSGGLLAAVMLVLASSAAALFTCARGFRQTLRAHYVHGVGPIKLLTRLGLAELLLLALPAVHLWRKGAPVRQWSSGGDLAGAADPSLMAMMSVPGAAWWTVAGVAVCTSLPVVFFIFRRFMHRGALKEEVWIYG